MVEVKIATWNVNSVKSRLAHLLDWLQSAKPDIVLLQELKCISDQFPFMEVESCGYNIAVCGQKTYNGVAILSKYPLEDVVKQLPGDTNDEQARYIEALVNVAGQVIRVASVYVPNGQAAGSEKFQYKMAFFDRLYDRLKEQLSHEEITVIGGDYNVAPEAIDVYDPVSLEGSICFHPQEREKWRSLCYLGYIDAFRACNDNAQFSWWDYRGGSWQHNKGMRIDHLLLSPQAADILHSSTVESEIRGREKASDHAPVVCCLQL